MIKSLSYSQDEILESIKTLYCPNGFEVDLTYGNGGFWKTLERPKYCFDKEVLADFVIEADSTNIPLPNDSVSSVVFDPPFLTYINKGREHNSIMGKRFGGYWTYDELRDHYTKTINECSRILKKKGILVFKCQDIIHNHKFHPTHLGVMISAEVLGFDTKDIFVLGATHKMPVNTKGKQQHARVYQSYFLVLEKQ
jgi:hypothetical protein